MPDFVKLPFLFPLYKGMKNEKVVELQNWLDDMAYWFPLVPKDEKPIQITGEFDEQTKNYVKAFQKFCGLPQSGVYTMETHGYMEWKTGNMMNGLQHIRDREAAEAAQKAADAKKKKTTVKAPKVPTPKAADPFAARHWGIGKDGKYY